MVGSEDDEYKFDILGWSSRSGMKYPIISEIATDILAVPISTVASKSAFSTGGRVLVLFRTSLSPEVVEALICCEDWIRSSDSELVADGEDEGDGKRKERPFGKELEKVPNLSLIGTLRRRRMTRSLHEKWWVLKMMSTSLTSWDGGREVG
ncbi:unnamed protein product [Linum trigynum]|uniref:HAT C-terminal dimerisation domain-containing protein n=1 Tax=Linum trigynum TaxID=586398 RepID=A0AAV2GPS3_9ROSI